MYAADDEIDADEKRHDREDSGTGIHDAISQCSEMSFGLSRSSGVVRKIKPTVAVETIVKTRKANNAMIPAEW